MGPSPAGRGGHIPRKTDAGQHQRPETPGGPLSGGRLRYLGQVARVVQQALRRDAEEAAEGQQLSTSGWAVPSSRRETVCRGTSSFSVRASWKRPLRLRRVRSFSGRVIVSPPSGLLLPEQQDSRGNAGADPRQFRSKLRHLGASSRCISSGRGTERARTSPVTGCRSRRAKEWRAGRGMRAASSVP